MTHESGLMTKECVATHTNCFFNFKTALYASAIVMICFNNSRMLL